MGFSRRIPLSASKESLESEKCKIKGRTGSKKLRPKKLSNRGNYNIEW
jgi:hypothetical protein